MENITGVHIYYYMVCRRKHNTLRFINESNEKRDIPIRVVLILTCWNVNAPALISVSHLCQVLILTCWNVNPLRILLNMQTGTGFNLSEVIFIAS